jgi:uncharacterized protein YjbJ (UPF0337 family)
MNHSIVEGKFDQLKGKAKQAIGETVGNKRLANSGAVDQVKGVAKEAWGNTKEAAHAVAGRIKANANTKTREDKQKSAANSHKMRERITTTAQNVKDSISVKATELQRAIAHHH